MPDPDHIRRVYESYPGMVTGGKVDDILALYAEDATVEDPIGSELLRGRDAIRGFYEAAAGAVTMKRTGPTRVAGAEAATPCVILMGAEGEQQALDVISTMKFDEAGKIIAMRAFWSFDALRPATADD